MKKTKQVLSILLAVLMIALSVPVAFAEVDTSVAAPYWGDVNGDHKADFSDILELNKIRLGWIQGTPEQLCFGDVNLNGIIQGVYNESKDLTNDNIFDDILQINQFRLGYISSFSAYSLAKFTFNPPTKTIYKPGELLNTDGMSVVVENKNNPKVKYTLTENISVTGYNANKVGTQQLTATFRGLTFKFNVKVNNYNRGEETYRFENYVVCNRETCNGGGHCFGMAVTSSGYYLERLSVSKIGVESSDQVYTVSLNNTVKDPICHYQNIQDGLLLLDAIVDFEWDEIVAHLKNHKSDNNGKYIVLFWGESNNEGHAVNFTHYERENNQDRVYVYDNNFPSKETYFYKANDGKIYQKTSSTYGEATLQDEIMLMDVEKFLEAAKSFDFTKYIYAKEGEIKVEGAEVTRMFCGKNHEARVMYKVPANTKEVNITPLRDNASFVYMNKTRSFNRISSSTMGKLKLSTINSGSASGNETFMIYNAPEDSTQPTNPASQSQPSGGCAYCGQTHTGFPGILIGFFHSILAMFGLHK